MPSEDRFLSRLFFLVLAALVGYLLWRVLRPFLSPILWAALLAFLLFPVNSWMRSRLRGRLGVAAFLMTLLVMIGIVLPATLVSLIFARQAADLIARLSDVAAKYHVERPQDIFRIPALDRMMRWITENTPVETEELRQWLTNGARTALEFLLSSGRIVLLGALGAVVSLLLMLFILYFFFRDGDEMAVRMIRLIPAPADRKEQLSAYLSQVTKAVVYGALMTALVQGTLIGVAFAVCGLPSPVVFGAVAAVASLLPVGGTAFVWVPGALVLWGQGRWGWAIFLAAWGALVVGTVDNLLRPLFISGRAQISTLPVFFGVVGGLGAFGLIGFVAGPVLIALALAVVGFFEEARARASPVSAA
jgi:predicted PurR-regulated permease PerM